MYDVIIIGAGVIGCAVARELSKYERKILVVDKASDICEGTSKANSGIIHAGFDAKPGSFKAKFNVLGNQMMEELSKQLDFPFQRNGSLVLGFSEADLIELKKLKEQGEKNGVKELEILTGEEARNLEPNLSKEVIWALYAKQGGIVCPFNLTIALAENAFTNGAQFKLNTEVQSINRISSTKEIPFDFYHIETNQGILRSRTVVNAAGVYADLFHNMVSEHKIKIIPRKGEYCLFDKSVGNYVQKTIFQLPTKMGKGVLVTPTIHGNLMVGPTAEDVLDKEDISTSMDGLKDVLKKATKSVKDLPIKQVITSFAGLRAHEESGDFIIGECEDAKGFFDVAGIESPGLTCAPAIGKYISNLMMDYLPANLNSTYKPYRKGVISIAHASFEERKQYINENPAYANVICRCEMVTEGEIMDAIHRPLGATTLDGIKRRTRAGSGRCQSGFCSPKVIEILARELKVDPSTITKSGEGSNFLTGFNKEEV
ncbi:NAD(P)/FAD-dependent oxidoreductase [Lachnoclostridium sp.]|uniref:NAD(P)/FAD-dependent oxidoreductase n=1 Tax=Lachnoclostridium sp. TaxID=2028282 RepID=UPI00289A4FA5|nr:NAD(P)/FAD-dependent oxidoreductase [Lachnoclostridium sp.]